MTNTGWLVLGLSLLGVGCSGADADRAPQAENPGQLALELQLTSGDVLTSVGYVLTGPGAFSKSGSIDVGSSTKISATIGGIPAGAGYTVTLTSTSTNGNTSCSGSGSFNVTAHETTPLDLPMTCKEKARTGSVRIRGALNICPVAEGITANPDEVVVGGAVALEAEAHDSDSGPANLAYQWTTTCGQIVDPQSRRATLHCDQPGTATVAVTVTDGDPAPGCADSTQATITFSKPVCAASGNCDDGNPCTSDVCSADFSCSHAPIVSPVCQLNCSFYSLAQPLDPAHSCWMNEVPIGCAVLINPTQAVPQDWPSTQCVRRKQDGAVFLVQMPQLATEFADCSPSERALGQTAPRCPG